MDWLGDGYESGIRRIDELDSCIGYVEILYFSKLNSNS